MIEVVLITFVLTPTFCTGSNFRIQTVANSPNIKIEHSTIKLQIVKIVM